MSSTKRGDDDSLLSYRVSQMEKEFRNYCKGNKEDIDKRFESVDKRFEKHEARFDELDKQDSAFSEQLSGRDRKVLMTIVTAILTVLTGSVIYLIQTLINSIGGS